MTRAAPLVTGVSQLAVSAMDMRFGAVGGTFTAIDNMLLVQRTAVSLLGNLHPSLYLHQVPRRGGTSSGSSAGLQLSYEEVSYGASGRRCSFKRA